MEKTHRFIHFCFVASLLGSITFFQASCVSPDSKSNQTFDSDAGADRAIETAAQAVMEIGGWERSRLEVEKAFRSRDSWHITIWPLPSTPCRFYTIEVSDDGAILNLRGAP
jgi:hypothetical protein